MELPYSTEVYRAAMETYTLDWFPLGGLAWCAAYIAYMAPRGSTRRMSAIIGGMLGAMAVFIGWQQQLGVMAAYNFMAPVYGWAWIALGLALLGLTASGQVRFTGAGGKGASAGVITLGLILFPPLAIFDGVSGAAAEWAGTMPDPTALVIIGALVLARGPFAWVLWLVPVGWAGVATGTAWLSGDWLPYLVTIGTAWAVYARARTQD